MKKRLLFTLVLLIYSAILIKVMVFKDVPTVAVGVVKLDFAGANGGHPPNFIPFKTILHYLSGRNGLIIAGLNLVGNVILLIPVGFLAPFVYKSMTWKKSLILAVASSLVIELMQTVLGVGIFDIDDVILNGLGVMIGYWSCMTLLTWLEEKKYKQIFLAITFCVVTVAVLGGLFLYDLKQQTLIKSNRDLQGTQKVQPKNQEGVAPVSGDLCNGTGGTGQIISTGEHTITIKSKRSAEQLIKLTSQTEVKNSAGMLAETDLKKGDNVTVVIDETETAAAVLVCN